MSDLLPLFLEEAGDRLERMGELLEIIDEDSQAAIQMRRELHALKGASRMMGLGELASLCHAAEDHLDLPGAGVRSLLEARLGELTALAEALAEDVENGSARNRTQAGEGLSDGPGDRRARPREEMRVASGIVDEMADRGARMRVLSVAAEGLADRVFNLGQLAERGVGERAPRQVLAALATSLRQVALDLESSHRNLLRLAEKQLDALLHLQVQPLRPFLDGLAVHSEDLARSLGKRIEVKVSAADAHLDRRIVDALREAFLHLVRNAVDHGIEFPEDRLARGKEPSGQILLEASTEGDRVQLRMEDNGRGIDPKAVLRAAVRQHLIEKESAEALAPDEVTQLLFLPGLSTREEATEVSGRGVGLDAVAAAVRSVGGDLWIESEVGEGTVVTVEVPLARRGERVLVLRLGEHQLAMPAAAVRAYRRVTSDMVRIVDGKKVLCVGGRQIPARFLSDLLGAPSVEEGVLAEAVVGGSILAIVAHSVLGEEEVIVRPLPRAAGAPRVVEGVALLASGRPVPVLSPQRLGPTENWDVSPHEPQAIRAKIRVLLVDDSGVTREMMRRLLDQGGFVVTGVASAKDAIEILEEREFDCMVTDIEMPGMDGLELTRLLRSNSRFSDLPVVVVSTLDRPGDRIAGLDSGADAYLTKQGLDARELIALIQRVGGGP
ncbi:MAG: response regulator [Thermoanaerobaculales bacterium]